MIALAVDPGPEQGGVVIFNWSYEPHVHERKVLFADDFSMEQLALAIIGEMSFDTLCGHVDHDLGSGFSLNDIDAFAMEDIVCMGKLVGRSTFDTAKVIGDLRRCWYTKKKYDGFYLLPRHDVKIHLCGGSTQKDPDTGRLKTVTAAQIKHAIQGRFLASGGGSKGEIGTKADPGPLYLMKGLHHAWSALAIGITCVETSALYTGTVVPLRRTKEL